jgi:hypothetical protein
MSSIAVSSVEACALFFGFVPSFSGGSEENIKVKQYILRT